MGAPNRLRTFDAERAAMLDLMRAAVRFVGVIEMPESEYTLSDDYNRAFMQADEGVREATLAYARSLSDADRRRLGRVR